MGSTGTADGTDLTLWSGEFYTGKLHWIVWHYLHGWYHDFSWTKKNRPRNYLPITCCITIIITSSPLFLSTFLFLFRSGFTYGISRHCPFKLNFLYRCFSDSPGRASYSCYAVSNHSGTLYSGHYTAYAKHSKTGNWHFYNDSRSLSWSENMNLILIPFNMSHQVSLFK